MTIAGWPVTGGFSGDCLSPWSVFPRTGPTPKTGKNIIKSNILVCYGSF